MFAPIKRLTLALDRQPFAAYRWFLGILGTYWWWSSAYVALERSENEYLKKFYAGDYPPEADSISAPMIMDELLVWVFGFVVGMYFLWALIDFEYSSKTDSTKKQAKYISITSWLITVVWLVSAIIALYEHLIVKDWTMVKFQAISVYLAIAINALIQQKKIMRS